MLSTKFIQLMRSFRSNENKKLDCLLDLGRIGVRISEKYSSRVDIFPVEKCLYLSEFQTPDLEKSEKHLLNLISTTDPLFSLMEYYDNYPYSYSDINYRFKACLKSGVEISIKAVDTVAKNNYFKKIHALKHKLKYYSFFMPAINEKYKFNEIIEVLEKESDGKFSLSAEINFTQSMNEYLQLYSDIPLLKKARFSKLYSYLSSENMIVSEFVYGSYFYELLEYRGLNYKTVLELIKIQLFFILKVGLFYNNLHSGNLVLGDDGCIYFLDCNTLATLSSKNQKLVFKILVDICQNNYNELTKDLSDLSEVELEDKKLEEIKKEFNYIFSINKTLSQDTILIKLLESFRVACEKGLILNKELFPVIKSFIYFNKLVKKTKKKNNNFKGDLLKILDELKLYL